ncbi:hypothetical protein [Pseudobutyrivibrio ruminis]|uniref:Uncharacterized protein n=1 Tax=Pseudobutyrivibrio ruminis DSM 9787 TaxID=1123011 RepID=A0A285T9D8_9FIRM|nr:hypothetical protein [Pseudobutyrivibrio ruminis]SOC16313.1 hypothetical protein SAMN02910411_0364 [Pseudobutyrivibrio ruminis DSM 9787]
MFQNVISNVKNLVLEQKIKPAVAVAICLTSTIMTTLSPAMCEINGNSSMQNFLKLLFSLLIFVGIILIIAGAVSLIRVVMSVASGETAQPGTIGRGAGLLVGGIVLCASKALVKAIIGVDPTTMTFM